MGHPSWAPQAGNNTHVPRAVGWSKFFEEELPVDREAQKEPKSTRRDFSEEVGRGWEKEDREG